MADSGGGVNKMPPNVRSLAAARRLRNARIAGLLIIAAAMTAGVLVATALVDLIPESIELIGGADPAVTTGIAAIVGFLLYAAVEAFIHQSSYEHVHDADVDHDEPHEHVAPLSGAVSTLGWLGPAGLIVHVCPLLPDARSVPLLSYKSNCPLPVTAIWGCSWH